MTKTIKTLKDLCKYYVKSKNGKMLSLTLSFRLFELRDKLEIIKLKRI